MSDSLVAVKTPRLLHFRPHFFISSSPPYSLSHHLKSSTSSLLFYDVSIRVSGGSRKDLSVSAIEQGELEEPSSIELGQITCEQQFDEVLAEAEKLKESVVILWMAYWCRKCIYLKPKLEKLAAEYYPRVQFYCIDVNSVPQSLVNRAGVKKMPTIQLWHERKMQGEVIGGHTAWLVIEDIRRMIDNEEI
ncbi:thioredoxin-like 3-2 [Carex littledalei]|uniref:Thioredoxin-like 3-2 n=1 Tax=Carex littledalei TaxID=544730 RepID=A0A833Q697_9POAL|nr:thioredoxin-like 3-2 [Carex littledalei]